MIRSTNRACPLSRPFFFFLMIRRPRRSPLFPSPPLSRSERGARRLEPAELLEGGIALAGEPRRFGCGGARVARELLGRRRADPLARDGIARVGAEVDGEDRKSTRLNSSHSQISYAVLCLK